MINPDQIVTADLLAGLTKCPFCGAEKTGGGNEGARFDCGTFQICGRKQSAYRVARCIKISESTLRARVQELEEAGDALQGRLRLWAEIGDELSVAGDAQAIANWIAVKKKGTNP